MGVKFNNLCESEDHLTCIEKYLLSLKFYRSEMRPRFLDGNGYDDLNIGKPCLRKDVSIKDNYTLRVFVNTYDIYYEVQTALG